MKLATAVRRGDPEVMVRELLLRTATMMDETDSARDFKALSITYMDAVEYLHPRGQEQPADGAPSPMAEFQAAHRKLRMVS